MLWLRGAKTLINFELVKPVCSWYINGRTDGRLTIAIPRFPLRASGALNLQDLKMADQKRTKTEKVGLENDGPNRSAGKCRIWKMTDPGTAHQSWQMGSAFSSPCDLVRHFHFPGPAFSRSCIFSRPVCVTVYLALQTYNTC